MAKKFLLKLSILFLPFLIVLATYLVKDPFKTLYFYKRYYVPYRTSHVQLDKDFVSTQNFINKVDIFHYDSYIFGNSRSMYFPIKEWEKYVDGTAFYHFDASGESLIGIYDKFRFLCAKNVRIKNALFVIDAGLLGDTVEQQSPVRAEHPALSGANWLTFQQVFFKTFINPKYLVCYYKLLLTNKYTSEMAETLLNDETGDYNDTTNEFSFSKLDSIIAGNSDSFYAARNDRFKSRSIDSEFIKQNLGKSRIEMLRYIRSVLARSGTNFEIIISPIYNQIKMNACDLQILEELFGTDNVFDFSGVNDITSDYHNYYEESHYRKEVATRLLDSVYLHEKKP